MPRPARLLSVPVLLAGLSPAAAQDATCGVIDKAIAAMIAAPAYHQTVEMKEPPMRFEGIVIGDTIHAKMEDKWQTIRLKPGGRKGMTEQMIAMSRIFDCKEKAAEEKDGRKLHVIEYMMTPPKGMPGVSDKPARHVAWIGQADMLIYRMTADAMTVNIRYENITPPKP